jgi:hypothetical protein
MFLIALAEVSRDDSLDGQDAVARTLRGESPGTGPVPKRGRKVW